MKRPASGVVLTCLLLLSCAARTLSAQTAALKVTPTISYDQQQADVLSAATNEEAITYPKLSVPHTDPVKVIQAMRAGTYNGKVEYVIAHRGYHSAPGCPEVSVCSIKAAYDAGSDGIELDVKLTSNNEIVLGHDYSTGRELATWTGKTASNWTPFTYYPSLDPYYFSASKPPKYLNVNQIMTPEDPANVQRAQHPLGDFYLKTMLDQYDVAAPPEGQITLFQGMYLIQTKYPMTIWLDVKDWNTMQYVAGVIQDTQARLQSQGIIDGPVFHIALKLGRNVVLGAASNPASSFWPASTASLAQALGIRELNYFWVFGTGDLDGILADAQARNLAPGGTPEQQLEAGVDLVCPANGLIPATGTSTGCLGIELVHKYAGGPTQKLYNYLYQRVSNNVGSQVATFQQVEQYFWYWNLLPVAQQALANHNTTIRADGSCCISLPETLNESQAFGAESRDDRNRWDWNEDHFSSNTTDEAGTVLYDLQQKSQRNASSLGLLGATTTAIPNRLLADGLYQVVNQNAFRALVNTGQSKVDSIKAHITQPQLWYVMNVNNPADPTQQYVVLRSASDGNDLAVDASRSNTTANGISYGVTTQAPSSVATHPKTLWRVFIQPGNTLGLQEATTGSYLADTPVNSVPGGSEVVTHPVNQGATGSDPTKAQWYWAFQSIKPLLSSTPTGGPGSDVENPSPIGPAGFIYCAEEGQNCLVPSAGTIAYGTNGVYHTYSYTGASSISCSVSNNNLGGDPVPGVYKGCFYAPQGALPAGPSPSATYCAYGDYGVCAFPNPTVPTNRVTAIVAYGSAANGWKYASGTNYVSCNPAAFGSTSNSYNTASTNACFLMQQNTLAAPNNLQASNITNSGFTVSWNDPNQLPGAGFTYTFLLNGTSTACTVSGNSCAFTGLISGTTYTVTMSEAIGSLTSPTSAPLNVATTFSSPVNLAVTDLQGTRLTAAWSDPNSLGGLQPTYDVQVYLDGGVSMREFQTSSTTFTVTGLNVLTNYHVTVYEILGNGKVTGMTTTAVTTHAADTPAGFTFCSNEYGNCTTGAPSFALFTARGSFSMSSFAANTTFACGTGTFSDPYPHVTKACFTAPSNSDQWLWEFCANEGGTCTISNPNGAIVFFGATINRVFTYLPKYFPAGVNSFPCSNNTWGKDPAKHYAKTCSVMVRY